MQGLVKMSSLRSSRRKDSRELWLKQLMKMMTILMMILMMKIGKTQKTLLLQHQNQSHQIINNLNQTRLIKC